MLNLYGEKSTFCDGISRRNMLQVGFLAMSGLSLADVLKLRADAATPTRKTSVIFIELAGGPSQFETYDPKPLAPIEYRGKMSPIATKIPGEQFCELLPRQATIADKISVIRSIRHPSNSHDPSSHLTQTGYYKTGKKGGPNQFPCFGSVIAHLRGANHVNLPAYVGIPRTMRNGRAAYLGKAFNPFETVANPNSKKFDVKNLSLRRDLSLRRLENRRELLQSLDSHRRLRDLEGSSRAVDQFTDQAFELIGGGRARQAFDIGQEPTRLRDKYGRNTVGQSTLLARRLIEFGVTCATVRCTGWDDHNNIFPRIGKRAPQFDQAVAALIEDLFDRGLDRDVLVVAMGEFGRTPRVNKNKGRDHWGAVMSVMLAGGGLKPGIIGSSNSKGEVPATSPYRPEDILGMVYRHLGIDPGSSLADHSGRPRYLLERRQVIRELL